MHKAIVVVDMQNDFIDGSLGTKEAQAVVPRAVARVKAAAADPDTLLLFTQDTHTADYLASAEGKSSPSRTALNRKKAGKSAQHSPPMPKKLSS